MGRKAVKPCIYYMLYIFNPSNARKGQLTKHSLQMPITESRGSEDMHATRHMPEIEHQETKTIQLIYLNVECGGEFACELGT